VLGHITGLSYGFAAAVDGHGADAARFAAPELGGSPGDTFAEAAAVVTRAFERPDPPDTVMLAPVAGDVAIALPRAVSFILLDYVIHGWDIARGIGVEPDYDPEVVDAALTVTESIPESAKGSELTHLFRHRVETTSTDPLDRIAALLGRSTQWRPIASS
jgi:uncharacterized protein (TIGR03086 family)